MWRIMQEDFRSQVLRCHMLFPPNSIGQNSTPWPYPTTGKSEKYNFSHALRRKRNRGLVNTQHYLCLSLIWVIWEIVQPELMKFIHLLIQLFISSICSRFNYLPNVSRTERIRLDYISLRCFPSPFLCLRSTSGTHRYYLAQQVTDRIVQTENS